MGGWIIVTGVVVWVVGFVFTLALCRAASDDPEPMTDLRRRQIDGVVDEAST